MTTTCPTCSSELPPGQSVCAHCATPVVATAATPASADLAPPPPPPFAPADAWAVRTETAAERAVGGIGWALTAAGAAMVIGSFLPWATVSVGIFSATVNGTDGDGVLTLILGLGVATVGALLASGKGARALWIVGLVLSGLAAAITVYDFANINDVSSEARVVGAQVSVGMGLWLCILASIASVVISIVIARRPKPVSAGPQV